MTTDGFCKVAKPLRLIESDLPGLSDGTKLQIRNHNKTGEALCDW